MGWCSIGLALDERVCVLVPKLELGNAIVREASASRVFERSLTLAPRGSESFGDQVRSQAGAWERGPEEIEHEHDYDYDYDYDYDGKARYPALSSAERSAFKWVVKAAALKESRTRTSSKSSFISASIFNLNPRFLLSAYASRSRARTSRLAR